jgi:phage shock protein PspC (stress-responsive transcriptional regulator)
MERHREEHEAKQSTAWGESPDEKQPDDGGSGEAPPGESPPGGGEPPSGGEPPAQPPAEPRRLYRSRDDRVIAGVCGGLGRYFGVDPLIFRIAALVLVFVGGSGLLLYLAAALLMPSQPATGAPAAAGALTATGPPPERQNRALVIVGVVLLVLVASPILFGFGIFAGAILFPIAFLALAGLAVWWLVSGEGPSGSGTETARRIGLGLGVLLVCLAIAIGGAWASAAGGDSLVAGLIIGAGALVLLGAFAGGRTRWLILPALSLAIPASFVQAAGIDMHGGVGERTYRPGSAADVRDHYELGMGQLVVDLRDASLPPGDHRVDIDVGVGEAVLVVPENVCVASRAKVGMGDVTVFGHDNGGIDVDWQEDAVALSSTPRVIVNADVGIGHFQVDHTRRSFHRDGGRFFDRDFRGDARADGNDACTRTTS